jgi:hypothetical protein
MFDWIFGKSKTIIPLRDKPVRTPDEVLEMILLSYKFNKINLETAVILIKKLKIKHDKAD